MALTETVTAAWQAEKSTFAVGRAPDGEMSGSIIASMVSENSLPTFRPQPRPDVVFDLGEIELLVDLKPAHGGKRHERRQILQCRLLAHRNEPPAFYPTTHLGTRQARRGKGPQRQAGVSNLGPAPARVTQLAEGLPYIKSPAGCKLVLFTVIIP